MEPFRYHVFICDQQKAEGVPCCSARGAEQVIEELRKEILIRDLSDDVQITVCGSLGLCDRGPNMVVYPGAVWYWNVHVEDVPEIVGSHFQQGRPVSRLVCHDTAALWAEICGNRNRFTAATLAREKAGVLPDALSQRIRAFQESRAILTAIELDIFTAIGEGRKAADVAQERGLDPRAAEILLNALVALGLLEKEGSVFFNTRTSAKYFAEGSQHNARPAMLHISHLWQRWSTLTDCLRTGTAVEPSDIAERGKDWTEAFIAAMERNAAERAPDVVRAVGAGGILRMLDIGGGSGAYSIAFARASEALQADIVDLPAVTPITRRYVSAAGLANRISIRDGDLRHDDFGVGYDLVLVSSICHMLSPSENKDLLHRCHAALNKSGRVVIQDFILEPDKTSPRSAALFSLNMLVSTSAGAGYSVDEYSAWMRGAGFREVHRMLMPGPTGLMIGTR